LGSYRTYEEWKPLGDLYEVYASAKSSYRTYEEWKPVYIRTIASVCSSFLPYLWGMETNVLIGNGWTAKGSYRTYEEWKLENVLLCSLPSIGSYRTYEEWKQDS